MVFKALVTVAGKDSGIWLGGSWGQDNRGGRRH